MAVWVGAYKAKDAMRRWKLILRRTDEGRNMMRLLIIVGALILSSVRAFAGSWPECDPIHLRFFIWIETAAELKRTGLPCNAHIEAAEALQEWLDYSLSGCVTAEQRRQYEKRLRDALITITDQPPSCTERAR